MTPATPDNASSQHFATALNAALGSTVKAYYGEAYDAIYMAAMGMALAEDPTDGASIKAALPSISQGTDVFAGSWADALAAMAADGQADYVGAAGDQDFDENGDVSARFTHQVFNDSGDLVKTGCWMPDGSECAE